MAPLAQGTCISKKNRKTWDKGVKKPLPQAPQSGINYKSEKEKKRILSGERRLMSNYFFNIPIFFVLKKLGSDHFPNKQNQNTEVLSIYIYIYIK